MGNITYKNAPLVELIVELRWAVSSAATVPDAPPFITDRSPAFDLWFNRLSGLLDGRGYHTMERLLPHNIPPVAYQPIFRYKKKRDLSFPIVQFGHGIFTINAGPPDYVSWENFRPEVEAGVQALIETIPAEGGPTEFISAMVRYVDAFRDDLKEGSSNYSFMKNDLQASLQLPPGLLELAESEDDIIPTMAIRFPLKGETDSQLTLQVAAGQVNKEQATVMDMNHIVNRPVPTVATDILNVLDSSHDTLHSVFGMMTSRITDRMKPVVSQGE